MITYNQIIQVLSNFFKGHYQVQEFKNGDLWEAIERDSFNDALYPLAFLVDAGANTTQGKVGLTFDLLCMDLVNKGESNENDVKSDTLQIILDAVSYLEQLNDGKWYTVNVDKQSSLSSFTERFQDELTGWKITITLNQPFNYNACSIPFEDAGISEVDCKPVTVTDSDGTTIIQVPSGGSFECSLNEPFEDVTITNSDNSYSETAQSGDIVNIPDSVISFQGEGETAVIENLPATQPFTFRGVDTNGDYIDSGVEYAGSGDIEIANVRTTNSDDTFIQIDTFNGFVELPDVTHTDTDGTPTTVPAMTPFVCTPATPTPDGLYNPTKTGNPSLIMGDDGQTQAGRLVDFYTLDFTNPYGNTVRFTNDLGGFFNDNTDGSTPDYVVDNATKLGYKLTYGTNRNLPNHIAFAPNLNIGSYNGFRVANLNEIVPVQEPGHLLPDRSIFGTPTSVELIINQLLNSTTCYRIFQNLGIFNIAFANYVRNALFVRNHTY